LVILQILGKVFWLCGGFPALTLATVGFLKCRIRTTSESFERDSVSVGGFAAAAFLDFGEIKIGVKLIVF